MAKFKKGDRVVFTGYKNDEYYQTSCFYKGLSEKSVGTVAEDNSTCPFVHFDGQRVAIHERDIELVSSFPIRVGDTVKFVKKSIAYSDFPLGTKAKVLRIRKMENDAVVQLIDWDGGWTEDDGTKHCQYAPFQDIELVNPTERFRQNIVMYRKGYTVVAQLHEGKTVVATAEAKCNPEDTFDFLLGSQIALQRLYKKIGKEGKYALSEDTKMKDILAY